MSIHRCDGGSLELGGGLEVLVAAALESVESGGEMDIVVRSRSTALEIPAWARRAGHDPTGECTEGRGTDRCFVVRIRRGSSRPVLADALPARGPLPTTADGALSLADLRDVSGPPLAELASTRGLVPLGALPEAGSADHDWRLNTRDRLWADGVEKLAERAAGAQWDASRDIPWEAAEGLPDHVEQAVAQVMTYIAQNEYAALYVPASFLPQVNPGYPEILTWLASHVHDEARHIEVFTKRALAGGARAYALASTELSLRTLMDENDFSAAALLLNVLGEGTFLDLLRFVELHAPDAATAMAARLAHRDERRHVRFGIFHIRRRLATDPDSRTALIASVEVRSAKLTSMSGLNSLLSEALITMAAPSRQLVDVAKAGSALRSLLQRMARNRTRRLRAAGFSAREAEHLSSLHTPNLM